MERYKGKRRGKGQEKKGRKVKGAEEMECRGGGVPYRHLSLTLQAVV